MKRFKKKPRVLSKKTVKVGMRVKFIDGQLGNVTNYFARYLGREGVITNVNGEINKLMDDLLQLAIDKSSFTRHKGCSFIVDVKFDGETHTRNFVVNRFREIR